MAFDQDVRTARLSEAREGTPREPSTMRQRRLTPPPSLLVTLFAAAVNVASGGRSAHAGENPEFTFEVVDTTRHAGYYAALAFGPGGVYAELIGEAAFRIAPLTDVDAEELVTRGKAGRLVAGFRGAPAADVRALADLVHRLARLGEDFPAVGELDLNPVLALADRCVAVDARVRVRAPGTVVRAKSW